MVIPPWDYQGPLSSGVGLPSSLSVLTLTPGRTWALSSPYLRPGSSHQVPSLSDTRMSGSQTGLVCSSHHKGSRGQQLGWGSVGFCRSSLRVPPVLLQVPHLASAQDLDSHLSATEAPPLIPRPQSLEDPDVRRSAHACCAHPARTVALD